MSAANFEVANFSNTFAISAVVAFAPSFAKSSNALCQRLDWAYLT